MAKMNEHQAAIAIQRKWRTRWLKKMAMLNYPLHYEPHVAGPDISSHEARLLAVIGASPTFLVHGTRDTTVREQPYLSPPYTRRTPNGLNFHVETRTVCFVLRFGDREIDCPDFVWVNPCVDLYSIRWGRLNQALKNEFSLMVHLHRTQPQNANNKYHFDIRLGSLPKVKVEIVYRSVSRHGVMHAEKQTTIRINELQKTFNEGVGSLFFYGKDVIASVGDVFLNLLYMIKDVLGSDKLYQAFVGHLIAHPQHCYDVLNAVFDSNHFEVRTANPVPIKQLILGDVAYLKIFRVPDNHKKDHLAYVQKNISIHADNEEAMQEMHACCHSDFIENNPQIIQAMREEDAVCVAECFAANEVPQHMYAHVYKIALQLLSVCISYVNDGQVHYGLMAMVIYSSPDLQEKYGSVINLLLEFRPDNEEVFLHRLLCANKPELLKRAVDCAKQLVENLFTREGWLEKINDLCNQYASQVVRLYHCRRPNQSDAGDDIVLLRVRYPGLPAITESAYFDGYPSHSSSVVHSDFSAHHIRAADSWLRFRDPKPTEEDMIDLYAHIWKLVQGNWNYECGHRLFVNAVFNNLRDYLVADPGRAAELCFVKPLLPYFAARDKVFNPYLRSQPLLYEHNRLTWRNAVVIMIEAPDGCYYLGTQNALSDPLAILGFPGGTVDGVRQKNYATEQDFYEAAVREAHEETGLDVGAFGLRWVGTYERQSDDYLYRLVVFHVKVSDHATGCILSADDFYNGRWVDPQAIIWDGETYRDGGKDHRGVAGQPIRTSNGLMIKKNQMVASNNPDIDREINQALSCEGRGVVNRMDSVVQEHFMVAAHGYLVDERKQCCYHGFVMIVSLIQAAALKGSIVILPYVYKTLCGALGRDFLLQPYPNCHLASVDQYRPSLYASEGHHQYLGARFWDGRRFLIQPESKIHEAPRSR